MGTESRFRGPDSSTALAVGLVTVVVAVGLVAFVAAGPAAANHEGTGNYTVVLPDETDHLPGDQNEHNASMYQFSSADDSFEAAGAPGGFETLDYLEVWQEEIDFSECDSDNTAAFGVDRGNNNSGYNYDDDLLQHMERSDFYDHRIEVNFYEEEDLGGDPTHLNPEDAIVSAQGQGSSGGSCFTMPTEPGWYQMSGLIEGTTADGEEVSIQDDSHYFPICDGCHDEAYAEEELGPPPSQQNGEATPTPEPETDDETTPTPEPETDDETTPTPEPETDGTDDDRDGTTDDGAQQDDATDDGAQQDDAGEPDDAAAGGTPTPGDGPGFGAVAALLALLGGGILARRR